MTEQDDQLIERIRAALPTPDPDDIAAALDLIAALKVELANLRSLVQQAREALEAAEPDPPVEPFVLTF